MNKINEGISKYISSIDWIAITEQINEKGFSLVSQFLSPQVCKDFIDKYEQSDLYSKTITMERYRFGLGEYKYFKYPLPDLIENMREEIYSKLVFLANRWMKILEIKRQYPNEFKDFQKLCKNHNQTQPTVIILKYRREGYNTLHQDIYGEIFFPFQVVFFLTIQKKITLVANLY